MHEINQLTLGMLCAFTVFAPFSFWIGWSLGKKTPFGKAVVFVFVAVVLLFLVSVFVVKPLLLQQ